MHCKIIVGVVVGALFALTNGCEEGAYSAHASDCNQFYRCVNGINTVNRCSSGLNWNQNAKICDWPENANSKSGSSSSPSKVSVKASSQVVTTKKTTIPTVTKTSVTTKKTTIPAVIKSSVTTKATTRTTKKTTRSVATTTVIIEGPTGMCSWYGAENEIPPNSYTACGDFFDRMAMNAAQPDIPKKFACGTKILVKNLDNNKTVVVTVDDKGPSPTIVPTRILDLTFAAFGAIGDRNKGVIPCSYQIIKGE